MIRRRARRPSPVVTVYTRSGCGLCAAAERLAAAETGRRRRLRLVDVDADPDLQRRYNIRVPVVAVDGHEIAEGHVAPGVIRAALRRARRGDLGAGPAGS